MIPVLPVFRRDLNVVPATLAGKRAYLVEDPASGSVVTLGEEEFFLCGYLDGVADTEQILQRYSERFDVGLGPKQLETFIRQLGQRGLLAGAGLGRVSRTFPELLDPETFLVLANIRLRSGPRLLDWLAARTTWLFSGFAQIVAGLTIAGGVTVLLHGWSDLLVALWAAWGPGFLILLIATSSVLCRSARSLAHGVICRRYKRSVPEVGVALLYFILPSVYCDWWDDVAWMREKRRRLWIVFAGLWFQMFVWAVATLGWWFTHPYGWVNTFSLALSTASLVTFLLLSANPLVQSEGYLMLSDWLEIPRLRERSLAVFGALLYGRLPPEPMTLRRRLGFTLWGAVVFLYAALMIVMHVYLAWYWLTDSYGGPGAVATLLLGVFLFQKPLLAFVRRRKVVRWLMEPRARARRWVAGGLATTLTIATLLLPCPYHAGGRVILRPARRMEVRTELDGMIERVLVQEGQWVKEGDPVARLVRRTYERDLQVAQAVMEENEAKLRLLEAGAKPEAIHVARAEVETARASLAWSEPRAKRYSELHGKGWVSDEQYETAVFLRDLDERKLAEAQAGEAMVGSAARPESLRAAQAGIAGAHAFVEGFQSEVERTVLTSPLGGRVVTSGIERLEGTYLEPGRRDLLFEIEDASVIQAEIEVPEAEMADVDLGAHVSLAVWAYHDRAFPGRVSSIAPTAGHGSGSSTVRVLTEIPNSDGRLKTHMSGFAKIDAGTRPLWYVLVRPLVRWVGVTGWYLVP